MKSLVINSLDFVSGYIIALGSDLGLDWRDLQTLRERGKSEGVQFFTKTLPLLGKALERGLAHGHFKLPTNFKKKFRNSEIPAFCGSLFADVFRKDGTLLPNFSIYAVYVLRQIAYCVNKVDLPCGAAAEAQVCADFLAAEKEVGEFNRSSFTDYERICLLFANRIILNLFSDFDFEDIRPNVGPGISSNCAYTEKFEKTISPGTRASGIHFFFNDVDAFERLGRYPEWNHRDYFRANLKARVILVPKDSRGPRLISCEPIENMFLQQGIMEYMVNRLESHPLTAGHVNFTDQSINQDLARRASKDLYWSTLDLKEASDRVSLKLVTHLFQGSPIFNALLETRTPVTIMPDGREIRLEKFAPMGSALCFPVMALCLYTLLYTCLCIEHKIDPLSAKDMVYVYGDDIIVPSEYAHSLISFIERFGLRVNVQKSFIGSPFAESCGVDAVKGNDVTPIRLRKCLNVEEPSTIISILQTGHQLSLAGLETTSEFLYSHVESCLGVLPYGTLQSAYLCRLKTARTDLIPEANVLLKGLKWRKQKDRQRHPLGWTLKAWTVRVIEQRGKESLFGRLMRTWRQIGEYDSPLMPFEVFARPRSVRLVRADFDHYSMSGTW